MLAILNEAVQEEEVVVVLKNYTVAHWLEEDCKALVATATNIVGIMAIAIACYFPCMEQVMKAYCNDHGSSCCYGSCNYCHYYTVCVAYSWINISCFHIIIDQHFIVNSR